MERSRHILLLLILSAAAACANAAVRVPRMPGGPDETPMEPMSPPPPVDNDFATNCTEQKMRSRHQHIRCAPDGSFELIQCERMMCFCVDKLTGLRLNAIQFPESESTGRNCSEVVECPDVKCTRICSNGYVILDTCATCMCREPPPTQRCDTFTDLVTKQNCPCDCVEESDTTCSTCNSECSVTEIGDCVSVEEDCTTGQSLKLVGRHGKSQCVDEPSQGQTCTPEEEDEALEELDEDDMSTDQTPRSRSRPSRRPSTSIFQRLNVGEIGAASKKCIDGFVCKQVAFEIYNCDMEDQMSPCVQARAADPSIRCDSKGDFKPLQCTPVEATTTETPMTAAGTSTAATSAPVEQEMVTTDSSQETTSVTQTTDSTEQTAESSRTGSRSREDEEQQMMCRCVEKDGSMTDGTSEVMVARGERRPSCRRVYQDCEVAGAISRSTGNPRMYRVKHSQEYFDAAHCRTCECEDGNTTSICSQRGNCTVVTPSPGSPRDCELEGGTVVAHGTTMTIGCETCGCKDSRFRCTKRKRGCQTGGPEGPTSTTPIEDPCDECRRQPPNPVCGPDGRNHLSKCTAIQCSGVAAVELQEGPCQSQDACVDYPCEREADLCISKKGSVACLGKGGCNPDHLRICINVDELNCPVIDDNSTNIDALTEIDSAEICGTDGQSYDSLCHLIQTTVDVKVAHAGACNNSDCQTGEVCGSDGVTYPNACTLQSQAITRLDYIGPCFTDVNVTAEEICEMVLDVGLCVVNNENCMHPVFPEDGCCPICGGSVTIALDVDALTDASLTNPDLQTVDTFTVKLLEADIFENFTDYCIIVVSITDTGLLQLVFKTLDEESSEFCNEIAKGVENIINEGFSANNANSEIQSQEELFALPQVYDYALAASAAPIIQESNEATTSTTTDNGAGRLETLNIAVFSAVIVAMAAVLYSH